MHPRPVEQLPALRNRSRLRWKVGNGFRQSPAMAYVRKAFENAVSWDRLLSSAVDEYNVMKIRRIEENHFLSKLVVLVVLAN